MLSKPDIQLVRFCRQIRQLDPFPDYPDRTLLPYSAVQELLYQNLFSEDAPSHLPLRYQLRVLKELVARIESSIDNWDEYEVSEHLMTRLSQLLTLPLPSELDSVQQKSTVVYSLSLLPDDENPLGGPQLFLLESRSLLAASGTTGLRTWEASIHLGQYLCVNPALVRNKHILELGTGTGYLSILCAKLLGATHVLASDGSSDVINNLPASLDINGLQESRNIVPLELTWGQPIPGTMDQAWSGGHSIDLVLGADITYDPDVIPSLIATICDLVRAFPDVYIIIAATERNRETFQSFKIACQDADFVVDTIRFPLPSRQQQVGPFYNDQVPIHICSLKKRS